MRADAELGRFIEAWDESGYSELTKATVKAMARKSGVTVADLFELGVVAEFNSMLRLCQDVADEYRHAAPSSERGDDWIQPIDWPDFWSHDFSADDWLIEPLVARGRQTAIYSSAKTGKSLLALDIAAAAATGKSVLGHSPQDPIAVVYVDLEMTEADLRERLVDLGYGPDDDLSRLSYFQLPELPGLDRDLGGEILVGTAVAHGAAMVVIDTMARAVQGEENNADTYRAFYWHTGRRLKAAGIALLRLDHQGKDANLGQRGSSAKVDDVDVVFKLTRTHTRVPWVPPRSRLCGNPSRSTTSGPTIRCRREH